MTIALAPRPLPRLGGLSRTLVETEIRRTLRNRRVFIFTLIMPAALFLLFGAPQHNSTVAGAPAAAYAMLSFAVYGAMVACTGAGVAVSTDRAQGWSRQLRLTPLRPAAYVVAKIASAMTIAAVSVVVQLTVGAVSGVHMPLHVWVLGGLGAWLGGLVFAAFGLFLGYLLSSENAMQIVGPMLAVLAFFGGLFVPLESMPHAMQQVAHWTPVYGVSVVTRSPLTGQHLGVMVLANVAGWLALFGFLAARLFRRDTARV